MPKLIIPKKSLPPVNAEQDAYFVRFRIITDDRNVSSYWSNIFKVDANTGIIVGPEVIVNHNSGIVTAAWEKDQGVINYDVWYSWSNGTGEWIYYGRTSQTGLIISKPSARHHWHAKN